VSVRTTSVTLGAAFRDHRQLKRLDGTPDGLPSPGTSCHEQIALTGPERLMLDLVDAGLRQSALRPAAMLVHALDIQARNRALIDQSRSRPHV
jgi:hypothetical protein